MRIIETEHLDETTLRPQERELVYNGLDACVTAELLETLLPQLDNRTAATYAFSRQLQGPVLEMRLRGVRVDQARKGEVIEDYLNKLDQLERNLSRLIGEAFDLWEFNWRSTKDLQELFYDRLGVPVVKRRGRPTVDRDALERFGTYIIAQPIVLFITAMRELSKKVGVLETEIDPDGRIRTSYNIAGTNTGRFSSSLSEFGTGTNLQNVEEALRSVFIADKGMKMAYIDAQQGESRCVGAIEWNLFRDGKYLDACESGDLHTRVAKLCWPGLAWPGTLEEDRALAELTYYRHYSRRFMCKKLGHGSNYGGQPKTLAEQTKTEIKLIEEFQPKYFQAFPAHLAWHDHVRKVIHETGRLDTLTGRRRYFFGRRDSDDTIREAIAYDPQGSLADIVNSGMLRVWRGNTAQLLLQNHDAVLVQYPQEREDEIIPKVLAQMRSSMELSHAREFVMPYDCKTGWNFGEYNEGNPDGLKAYRPGDRRCRQAEASILDRKVSSFNRKPRANRNLQKVGSD